MLTKVFAQCPFLFYRRLNLFILVYVSYPDITAEDFLFVQTDIDYRREWDDTVIHLDVIESDKMDETNGDVIYWEMLWPKLFSNRDYVFVRNHFIDRQRNLILIANKSTKHPNCPVKPGLQRVKEYWSFMVIKPKTTFNEPGIEFILTYYDNPGDKVSSRVSLISNKLCLFCCRYQNSEVCNELGIPATAAGLHREIVSRNKVAR